MSEFGGVGTSSLCDHLTAVVGLLLDFFRSIESTRVPATQVGL